MTLDINSAADWRVVLLRAINERGFTFVYPDSRHPLPTGATHSCVYLDEQGQPSCLIGHGLAAFGVRVPAKFNTVPFINLAHRLPELADLSDWLVAALGSAQAAQDRGHTWGEAYDRFMNYFTESTNGG